MADQKLSNSTLKDGSMHRTVGMMIAFSMLATAAAAQSASLQEEQACLSFKSDPDLALRTCSKIISRDPRAAWAYNARGRIYSAKGDANSARAEHEKALVELTRAIQSKPSDGWVHSERALHLLEFDSAEKALPDAERGVQLEPSKVNPLHARAKVYEALGRKADAIADYRRVLILYRQHGGAIAALKRLGASY